ncbi:heavy metal translocating P-type ATPase [Marinibactrum halimedae]|uniref:P-type Cu(2+) transporter n=1 Tax=Marinibactrum halimedae TaxID=1444977 RepID=A0AA37WMF0_9GAMM|nr:heavy metal translocating P-type ATPase [Marinibactrum halimedae]MCD9457920.1 heavy metal translocating P-type ATPase [Marinibactrum halimedae]GLS26255.1 copper-translocating P-type ATPase [Marinibactrum halimedae]
MTVDTQQSAGCYHCGLPVPNGSPFRAEISGEQQDFCCPGCQAVAQSIHSHGLDQFYQFRSQRNKKPSDNAIEYAVYDLPAMQEEFVSVENNLATAQLLVEGMTCAACVWLIEHHLGQVNGVERARVNATSAKLSVSWLLDQVSLSKVMAAVAEVGYQVRPATEREADRLRQKDHRQALMRLGVAGFGMMQVGMVSVGLYTGAAEQWQLYLRWISFLLATPVVLYAARPFFEAAWRAIKQRQLVMDVPVSMAIGGAYLASCWATVTDTGEVYFDSVSMFTFFLLLGRFLEMRARHRNGHLLSRLAQLLPMVATRVMGEQEETVPRKALQVKDWVKIAVGDTVPCDGRVVSGESSLEESILTGEAAPVKKQVGDNVIAGTINRDAPLTVEVTATGHETKLSAIERLVENAAQHKPRQVAVADRLAGVFVAGVLVIAAFVGGYWWLTQPEDAFWIVLSILVVTCPCALSLATPAALTAAVGKLRSKGFLVTQGQILEGLDSIDTVVFDKTGTLTVGKPTVVSACDLVGQPLHDEEKDEYLRLIAALESGSSHPIATAFSPWAGHLTPSDQKVHTGDGVSGEVNGKQYRFGHALYALGGEEYPLDILPPIGNGQWLLLSQQTSEQPDRWVARCWVCLADALREDAKAAVAQLQRQDVAVELLSGDTSNQVQYIAQQLGIECATGSAKPEGKLRRIRKLQAQGKKVMVVGDGINDVPILSGANVSVAMNSATDLAQTRADSILLSDRLTLLPETLVFASRLKTTIRQNLTWALAYNGLALPLAAAGWVPPWAAAIGMSASSLIVVLNALRLGRAG